MLFHEKNHIIASAELWSVADKWTKLLILSDMTRYWLQEKSGVDTIKSFKVMTASSIGSNLDDTSVWLMTPITIIFIVYFTCFSVL